MQIKSEEISKIIKAQIKNYENKSYLVNSNKQKVEKKPNVSKSKIEKDIIAPKSSNPS